MKNTKKANILIYTIVLVNLALIMAIVVLNNTILLENTSKMSSIEKILSQSIMQKASFAIKYTQYLNSNGAGFVDIISCPDSVTMSGSTLKSTGLISTIKYNATGIYCTGVYNANEFKIFFNGGINNLSSADYLGSLVNLGGGSDKVGVASFSDGDSTLISFLGTSYNKSDSIDDNMNSDNYSISSTGSTFYPFGYEDDDVNARKTILGYIPVGSGYTNIFWNNSIMEDYIEANSNNIDPINQTVKTNSGYLYLDSDMDFDLKIVTFDKTSFTQNNDMQVVTTNTNMNILSGSGYIQDNLTLSSTLTGSEYVFDFSTYDYGVFIKNIGTGVLSYKITGESLSGSGMYINPIDDSPDTVIKILGSDIFINEDGLYISKQQEIIGKK